VLHNEYSLARMPSHLHGKTSGAGQPSLQARVRPKCIVGKRWNETWYTHVLGHYTIARTDWTCGQIVGQLSPNDHLDHSETCVSGHAESLVVASLQKGIAHALSGTLMTSAVN